MGFQNWSFCTAQQQKWLLNPKKTPAKLPLPDGDTGNMKAPVFPPERQHTHTHTHAYGDGGTATHEQSWRIQQQSAETSAEGQQHTLEFPHMKDD